MGSKYYRILSLLLLIFLLSSKPGGAKEYYLFIGSYNWEKEKPGIYTYKFNDSDGSLIRVSAIGGILNPSYLALSPDGNYLYACTGSHITGGGSVSSFEFHRNNGVLTFINSRNSAGENPVYLAIHKSGHWLVNANYTEGSVSVFPLGADGQIKPLKQLISFSEGSINKQRQDRAHIHATVFAPGQDYIFLPDLGADKIRCYAFDTSGNTPLHPATQTVTAAVPGSGPRHFTFHPNNRFCYCIEEMTATVSGYRYENGKLEFMERVQAHSKKKSDNFSGADIHISPDGRFLYASVRGSENDIAIFSVNTDNGRLTLIGYQSTYGDHPRNFTIDPGGKFLLVANQYSGNVVVLKRDMQTGLLAKTVNEINIPGASCLVLTPYTE